MQVTSQIALSQADIETAIKLYIASSGMKFDVDPEIVFAKRGAISATVEISVGLKANLGPINLDILPGSEDADQALLDEVPEPKVAEVKPAKSKAVAAAKIPAAAKAKAQPVTEAASAPDPFIDNVPTATAETDGGSNDLFAQEEDTLTTGESDLLPEDESPKSSDDNLFG